MSHSCAVPAATGQKPVTWRCPDCGKRWDFQPGRTPNPLFGHRNQDGSKSRWWQ